MDEEQIRELLGLLVSPLPKYEKGTNKTKITKVELTDVPTRVFVDSPSIDVPM